MLDDFSAEYYGRSDDELLQLATQRHYLTAEAAGALDAELRRRNLTEADRIEHQKFVKRQERRESRTHRRKTIDPFKYQMWWRDILCAFGAMALISFSYLALPKRYHMASAWELAALCVMIATVLIIAASKNIFWHKSTFWISLAISSTIHLLIAHTWAKRTPLLSRGAGKGATFFGFFLFLGTYWLIRLLQRKFDPEKFPA
jgi:hypothetical protein